MQKTLLTFRICPQIFWPWSSPFTQWDLTHAWRILRWLFANDYWLLSVFVKKEKSTGKFNP